MATRLRLPSLLILCGLALSACGLLPKPAPESPMAATGRLRSSAAEARSNDVVIFALSLVETGYRFGGKNPEAGLDCSGMISYVFDKAGGVRLTGSAADLARLGRPVDRRHLLPGDLVFFNTRNQSHSHVGIYIGEGRFIHAPSSKGTVRTETLDTGWFATRFEEGRSYLD